MVRGVGGCPWDFRRTMNSVSCSAAGEGISRCFQWSVSRTALSYVVMDDDNFLWSVVIDCPVFFCQIVWTMYNMHSLAYVGRDRSKFIPFLLFVHVCLSIYNHTSAVRVLYVKTSKIYSYLLCVLFIYIFIFNFIGRYSHSTGWTHQSQTFYLKQYTCNIKPWHCKIPCLYVSSWRVFHSQVMLIFCKVFHCPWFALQTFLDYIISYRT